MTETEAIVEKLVNPNLLYADKKIAAPNFKEAFDEIDLLKEIQAERGMKQLESQVAMVAKQLKINKVPKSFMGFVVPLESYLPLTEPYHANLLWQSSETKSIDKILFSWINGVNVNLKIAGTTSKSRVSAIMVCVNCPDKLKINSKGMPIIQELYEEALKAVNYVIGAYKLTPLRHNHDLQAVSRNNRSSKIQIVRFNTNPVKVVQTSFLDSTQNLFAAIAHSRPMSKEELNYFKATHVELGMADPEIYDIILNIINAVDARCLGDYEQSVIKADKYGELFLRFMYCHLLMYTLDSNEAFKQTNEIVNMKSLLNKIAKLMNKTSKEVKVAIANDEWELKCRKVRNTLNHNFLRHTVTAEMATDAIDSTIKMVVKLANLVEGQNEATNKALAVFKSTSLLLRSADSNGSKD
jgi:hypothetical protein